MHERILLYHSMDQRRRRPSIANLNEKMRICIAFIIFTSFAPIFCFGCSVPEGTTVRAADRPTLSSLQSTNVASWFPVLTMGQTVVQNDQQLWPNVLNNLWHKTEIALFVPQPMPWFPKPKPAFRRHHNPPCLRLHAPMKHLSTV